jgi:hypothetical protein
MTSSILIFLLASKQQARECDKASCAGIDGATFVAEVSRKDIPSSIVILFNAIGFHKPVSGKPAYNAHFFSREVFEASHQDFNVGQQITRI